jgi:hypothetical protein
MWVDRVSLLYVTALMISMTGINPAFSYCQALGYSGPVRAVMPSNFGILAHLTAIVAR